MCLELVVAIIVEPLDGGVPDGLVQPLNPSVCSRVTGFGEAMLDIAGLADHLGAHLAWPSGGQLQGCSANRVPLSVRIKRLGWGRYFSTCCRNHHAFCPSALPVILTTVIC